MQHAAAMRERHRVADLHQDLQELGEMDRIEARIAQAAQRVIERHAANELHAKKLPTELVDAELVNGDDARKTRKRRRGTGCCRSW